ncbi:extracellular solute-binding protein [Glycomyces lechevalierae]|uniref:Cellobiose transport system substrate-binding protein n=2 Tax=Glycomyces lechevalierae TaxID=256034 RepID=A0A9X3PGH3_9ACTN|nr:extracellular solute-binding protein [Glycomyces lechevalierae]MDA1383510.1 extracellular solute-binding protein [Glycomyces lechevalierae]MDR7341501.1 cellobiose transport system substrate-binding protein [Glycomyces lechevalierae]
MKTRPIRAAMAAAAAAALALTAACSGGGDDDGKITLSVGLFGDFGFGPLYEEYTKLHPEIEFEERIAEFADHHTNLTTHLATGSGAADIEAVEVGYISQYTAQPDRFHNLLDLGAADLEGQWLDWKWQQALSKDGESLIGLGTDVGGMAMCYRRDLFEQAGLPVERDEVSALWAGSWEDYVEVGRLYSAATGGDSFFESSGNMFRAMVEQADEGVYDREDNLVVESNPAIGDAWDLTVEAIEAGMSNRLQAWTPEWNAGFNEGTFATIICPAWMTSYIETNAPDSAGLWDIATVPGGAGNMGGSHLVLPAQGDHPEEAYEFIEWLTAPEQQLKVFESTGNFPSTPGLYEDEALTGLTKPYFNDAPVGQIFTAAAQAVRPQYQGPLQGDVLATIGQGLGRIEDGSQTPDEAWTQVLADLESF